METLTVTTRELFRLPRIFAVPLFQRAYVWRQEAQWAPLWDDLVRLVEAIGQDPTSFRPHFFGAIVVQARPVPLGAVPRLVVIDGQQRLTTLLLAIDAVSRVLRAHGHDECAAKLDALVRLPPELVMDEEERYRVLPTNVDRAAFASTLGAPAANGIDGRGLGDQESDQHGDEAPTRAELESAPEGALDGSLLSEAHRYFFERAWRFLAADGAASAQTAADLSLALSDALRFVLIQLGPEEDSQEIFETLNARGTPLTAVDLIKNLVFQRLSLGESEAETYYKEHWARFETPFWEAEVQLGATQTQRGSLFFSQWLVAKTGTEVTPRFAYSRFKHYVDHDSDVPMTQLLQQIHRDAAAYEAWVRAAAEPVGNLDPVELFVYRTQAAGVETVKPLLLWLLDPESGRGADDVRAVLAVVESWVVRRSLLQLPTASLGRVIADVIRVGRDAQDVAGRVTSYLATLSARSTYWPSDTELRAHLQDFPIYARIPRPRLRMLLEALEDDQRGFVGERPWTPTRVTRGGMEIEHVMPRQWQTYWPLKTVAADRRAAAEIDRAQHIHRLGNLTLLPVRLNSRVSNGRWLGAKGKLAHFERYSTLLLNRYFTLEAQEGWDEAAIDRRTAHLTEAIERIWPAPATLAPSAHDVGTQLPSARLSLSDLIVAGTLRPGSWLQPRASSRARKRARIEANGEVTVDGVAFDTLSGAARQVAGHATSGWRFWCTPDGRTLWEIREETWRSSQLPD